MTSLHRIAPDLGVKDHSYGWYSWMMSNTTTQNRTLLLYKNYDALTIAKVQMLNKPCIHYIDVKSSEQSAGNHWTDILIRQQEFAGPTHNDMFIRA